MRRKADDVGDLADGGVGQKVSQGPSEAKDAQVLRRATAEQRPNPALQLSTADAHRRCHMREIEVAPTVVSAKRTSSAWAKYADAVRSKPEG